MMNTNRSPQSLTQEQPPITPVECGLCGELFLLSGSGETLVPCKLCPTCSAVVNNNEELLMSPTSPSMTDHNVVEFTDDDIEKTDKYGFVEPDLESIEELAASEEEDSFDDEDDEDEFAAYGKDDLDDEEDEEDEEDEDEEDDLDGTEGGDEEEEDLDGTDENELDPDAPDPDEDEDEDEPAF
jgi:hypothetical protein